MRNIWVILNKELSSFFNSLIAYLVLIFFLAGVGLFFWVFGDNVLISKQSSMADLFVFAPWFFLITVPAITMRSFAEEVKTGTHELLATKPVTDWQILLGKYLASVSLVVFALIPTLIYYFTLQNIGNPPGNLDSGPVWGAYIGLIFVGAIFCSIGIFASTLTSNQIVSFILATFACFVFYAAFDFTAELEMFKGMNVSILKVGIMEHYRSISRGVVDTRDLSYFVAFIAIVLVMAKTRITLQRK